MMIGRGEMESVARNEVTRPGGGMRCPEALSGVCSVN